MNCRSLQLAAVAAIAWPLLAPALALRADEAPSASVGVAEPGSWPRSLPLESGTVVVYQPQLEKLEEIGRASCRERVWYYV